MLAVLIAASTCVCAGVVLRQRSVYYREQAALWAIGERASEREAASSKHLVVNGWDGDSDDARRDIEKLMAIAARRAALCRERRLKYERAARYPWLRFDPPPAIQW
jgi:hypothetical protein